MSNFVDELYNFLQKKRNSKHKVFGYSVPNWSKKDVTKLGSIGSKYGFPPQWLANLINFESAGTFNPAIRNPNSGATGLIQFMPQYFNTLKLRLMSVSSQLDEVDKYIANFFKSKAGSRVFDKVKGKVKSNFTETDLFMMIFYPASVGKPLYLFPLKVVVANNGITTPTHYTKNALSKSAPFKDFPQKLIPFEEIIDEEPKSNPIFYKLLIFTGISLVAYMIAKKLGKNIGKSPIDVIGIKL